jgi:hypothetical protein
MVMDSKPGTAPLDLSPASSHHGADFTINNIPRSIKMIDPKININCNFWDCNSNSISLSYCNHLIHKIHQFVSNPTWYVGISDLPLLSRT